MRLLKPSWDLAYKRGNGFGLLAVNLAQKKASTSCSRHSLFRALSIAAAGSGLLYAKGNSYSNATVSLAVPLPLRESVSLPWSQHLIPLRPSFISADHWHFGILPLFYSRVSPAPSADIQKESPGVVGDGPKPSCGCLGRDTIANAAARVGPAVVNLSVPQGLVDVTLQDGRTFEGTVVNADLHSDIAIVKIKSKTPLPTAKLGSSSKLRPGDWVIAMGCPLSLQNTVTAGIVSCVDRKSSDLGLGGMRREYLQTDCAINAGNSGGPLVNVDGQVVGVNIMKVLAADGLSFAVPIDSVIKIIEHFKKSGRVVRPWLGLKMIDLNEMITAQLKERDPRFPNVDRGVLVPMVTPGSPADRAGFHPGDVVIEFDGKPVESIKEIIEIMGDRVGIPMKVVVKRPNDICVSELFQREANPDM
ncbi:hypothetical protein GH714_042203 [Hevea brasiliensis]|uniref:PDZ domain-containing protein n=1 Tax=Hevea brasiliensis TaxID=3981 RepID=A0A6A6MSJ3_HEVBR|nr:hypothetical protein GH714_042203 [Hevea brasiliensis]